MAHSQAKTSVAVLRKFIGLTVSQFAELIGKSENTVKSLESGRLKLSETLAITVEQMTGVDSAWLLENKPDAPIKNIFGASYSIDDYELSRAKKSNLPPEINNDLSLRTALSMGQIFGEKMAVILASAAKMDPSRLQVAMFRADEWIKEFETKFTGDVGPYLEYRSRVEVVTKHPDGSESEIGAPIAPSTLRRDKDVFLRSIREIYGDEVAKDTEDSLLAAAMTRYARDRKRSQSDRQK